MACDLLICAIVPMSVVQQSIHVLTEVPIALKPRQKKVAA